jgi:hypothetical protein
MLRPAFVIVATVLTAGGAGCSWQQAYSAAQEWQRNQCNRLTEQTERDRCLNSTKMSYEDYRRQTEEGKRN